jgi:hypothetical protein
VSIGADEPKAEKGNMSSSSMGVYRSMSPVTIIEKEVTFQGKPAVVGEGLETKPNPRPLMALAS